MQLSFENTTNQVRARSLSQVRGKLKTFGVALLNILDGEKITAELLRTDPVAIVNQFYAEEKKALLKDPKMLYGMIPLKRKDARLLRRCPVYRQGFVNLYNSPVQMVVYDSPRFQVLVRNLLGREARIWPERLRVQVPYGEKRQGNSHCDHDMSSDLKLPQTERKFKMIVALNGGRPFEYCKDTHSVSFWNKARDHGYGGGAQGNAKHFHQFHLENPDTPDPLHLRASWARVEMMAGDILIFDYKILHRVAQVRGAKCVWSMFIAFDHRKNLALKEVPETICKPGKRKRGQCTRTLINSKFTCKYQAGGSSRRDVFLFSLLLNYQTYRWPSLKLCSYFPPGSIGPRSHLPIKECKVVRKPVKNGGMMWTPVWPAGLGCTFNWARELRGVRAWEQLKALDIPAEAFKHPHWMFNPLELRRDTQILLGFLH
eukprot:CAMPEP_0184490094 /NCGR_PEP_ID=MMETSP0113_2-20130426/17135_1 /TAXON_ID=91329 /ORGANISM="Norrisiella sphaerica, Strain BC52" /LENGTH=428 /DNA_ID=CAMNT_0026873843 /DNA_START=68 /DNA_END=1354 /DNA_ORIENTATION=+